MIRLRTAVRVMPALWLAIPICVFAGWYVTLLAPSDRYALGASAKASMTIAFVGSLYAACAAWEGSRLRRARIWDAPSVRSRATIAFWCLLPVVLVGLVAVLVAICVQLIRSGAGLPDMRIVLITALDLTAYSVAGFAAGLLLPFAVAGPLAIAATFIWIGFVPAIYPVWLRHLTGMFRDCCGLEQDLAPRALLASAILDLGIIAAAVILVAGPVVVVARRLGGALATLGVTSVAGVLLVSGMTYAPVVPRDPALLECQADNGVTVCTWPEHRSRAPELARIVAEVRVAWQQAGVDAPSVFTEAHPAVAPAHALTFQVKGDWSSEDEIVSAMATGMAPTFPDCPFGATGSSYMAFMYLQAWYAQAGGMTHDGLRERYADAGLPQYPAVMTVVDELQAARPEIRRAWVSGTEEVSQACDERPLHPITAHP